MSEAVVIDPLVTSWFETVQALKTVEEREELSRFIRHDLRQGVGAGILRGLFLLLKANRLYLEDLPDKFNQELVQPTRDLLLRLERSLAVQMETQSQIAVRNERAAETSLRAMKGMEGMVPKVDTLVQNAVDRVDTKAVTQQITATLLESTVEPVRQTNLELLKMADLLADLIGKVKQVLETLLKVTWKKMFLSSLGISFVVWTVIFFFVYQGMQRSFETSLQADRTEQNQRLLDLSASIAKAGNNRSIGERLSRLQVTTDVSSVPDETDRYALTITKAYDAKVLPDGTGVIYFEGPPLNQLIEEEIEANKKLIHH
jgi:hypothetical protein